MSSQFNTQYTEVALNINYYNYTATTVVDLTNQTVTGWENGGACFRRTISENITIQGTLDYLKYNTTYEGIQRVSWDGGRNFYHTLSVNNQSFLYYDRYTNDVKYVYQPDDGIFVDMGYGFRAANWTRQDFDLGYKCSNVTNYTASFELFTEQAVQLAGISN